MKKIIFFIFLLFGFILTANNPGFAADVTKQVDIGSFDVWKNSAGAWIPSDPPRYTEAYKPGDTVHVTYTVTAPASITDKVTGVKSVSFITPDNAATAFDGALSAINYKTYDEIYYKYQVTDMLNLTFSYTGNGAVEITADAVLTGWIEPLGYSVKKVWQGQNVDGRQFYLPALIEWETSAGVPADAPDFWPSVPLLTYTGDPGTTIEIPAMVFNTGADDTTDFAAAWDGSGWAAPVASKQNLTITRGEKVDTPFTVTVPEKTTKLWLKANVDGKTPADEINQENNLISVTVGPKQSDVDISITGSPVRDSFVILGNKKQESVVNYTIRRKDAGTETITAIVTMLSPDGKKTKETITLAPGQVYGIYDSFKSSVAGTYQFNASVWPVDENDVYQPDNVCGPYMVKYILKPARVDNDPGIEGQLGG